MEILWWVFAIMACAVPALIGLAALAILIEKLHDAWHDVGDARSDVVVGLVITASFMGVIGLIIVNAKLRGLDEPAAQVIQELHIEDQEVEND